MELDLDLAAKKHQKRQLKHRKRAALKAKHEERTKKEVKERQNRIDQRVKERRAAAALEEAERERLRVEVGSRVLVESFLVLTGEIFTGRVPDGRNQVQRGAPTCTPAAGGHGSHQPARIGSRKGSGLAECTGTEPMFGVRGVSGRKEQWRSKNGDALWSCRVEGASPTHFGEISAVAVSRDPRNMYCLYGCGRRCLVITPCNETSCLLVRVLRLAHTPTGTVFTERQQHRGGK